MKDQFLAAIHGRNKIRLRFYSKEDSGELVRLCAPMDFGPSRRPGVAPDDRYHLWDYESDQRNHTLSLKPEQVAAMAVLEDQFDPADFVTWPTNWFVPRQWGRFS